MEQAHRNPRLLRFGVFELDPRSGELRKHGLKIKLQERPFEILAMLLERPGKLVTREELRGSCGRPTHPLTSITA